ncbi:hypothetical protein, partial [Marinobacter xestospongiae]
MVLSIRLSDCVFRASIPSNAPAAGSTTIRELPSADDFLQAIKNPNIEDAGVFGIKSLTMTYSRMGKC